MADDNKEKEHEERSGHVATNRRNVLTLIASWWQKTWVCFLRNHDQEERFTPILKKEMFLRE
jgi:hypothetical protein